MLTHIVCWKYKTEATEEQRENHRAELRKLSNTIAEVLSLSVGADVLHLARSFDTALVATFADRAALDVYDAHDEHKKVQAIGREIAEKVVSVDFVGDELISG